MINKPFKNIDPSKENLEDKVNLAAIIPNYLYEGIDPKKEFIEDKERIPAIITCSFHLSASVKHIGFIYKDNVVATGQNGCDLILHIEREISKNLFYSAKKNHVAETFIVGYINEIIPILNEHLIQQKYSTGHLLIRTFSPLDIQELYVANKDTEEYFKLSWPISFTNFPRTEEFAEGSNYKFIRDLIEASTFYFYYNLDDCVRKIISSAENFYNLRNIIGKSFKEKLKNSIKSEDHKKPWEPYLKIFYSNLMFVYRIRNKIVHEKYRMDFNDSWLCQKGIGTLFYLYQSKLNDNNTRAYNYSLMKQFVALDFECKGLILDMLKDDKKSENTIMKTKADTDKVIFGSLEITKEKMDEIEIKIKSYNN
jgi:hypothetical protein